jgi:glyoxylase-like metal-dependent hydrolase (beta-lactamase superfamily II)
MNVLTLTLGALATNCYLVWQPGQAGALLVDAAGEPEQVLAAAKSQTVGLRLIVLTHGHIDHIEGAARLKRLTGAELAIHELDANMLGDAGLSGAGLFGFAQERTAADRMLHEGDVVALEGTDINLEVLHTPGHTPGSICLLAESVLFSGDCLFAGGIGRVDLPGGDEQAMARSLARLAALDGDLTVYPGHGPATTMGEEQGGNPWLHGW